MNRTTRTFASAVTTMATVVVGVVGARAIKDNDDNSAVNLNDEAARVVIDAEALYQPVLETDGNSTQTTAGDIGSGGVPIGDSAGTAGLMFVDDPIEGPYALPQSAFDSCAGASRGAAAGANCPKGYAGVLGGEIPPAPFVWGTPGRYLTAPSAPFPPACPASTPAGEDHNAITVFSRTPLESLTVKWRPYGTTDPWVSLITPAVPLAERQAWMRRFETEGYSREAFGYLTLCGIHIDRDPDAPYEVVLEATDSFDRPVTSRPFVMHDGTPSGRPPTQAYIVGDWVYIDGWAPADGTATFATRTITDSNDRACPPAGDGEITHSITRDDQLFVSPIGVYDPTFTRKISTWIPLPEGELSLVCTTIHVDGIAVPLATDIHVVDGLYKVPVRFVPQGIGFDRYVDLPAGNFVLGICGQQQLSGARTNADDYPYRVPFNDTDPYSAYTFALEPEIRCPLPALRHERDTAVFVSLIYREDLIGGRWVEFINTLYIDLTREGSLYTMRFGWNDGSERREGTVYLKVIHSFRERVSGFVTLVASSDR
ncbi:MAG: hypothetical protein ABL953_07350 [Ilumatobacteraceae bacterium]